MLLVSVSRTFQSDVVMCSTSQRTPSTSGAQLAFEPYNVPNAVPSTMRTVQSRMMARENVVNMRIHLLKQ